MHSRKVAGFLVAAGAGFGFGACAVDIATCEGEVKHTGGDLSITRCDENPRSDNWVDSPGTPEQVVMYGAFSVAALGGAALYLTRGEAGPEKSSVQR